MSYFTSFIPNLIHVLATPPKDAVGNPTGPSAANSIQSMLAGVGAAAGNSSGLESMILQRQYRQQLADQQMKQKQLDLATQNATGEAALRNAQIGNLNSEVAARQNPPIKPREEKWNIVPNISGANGEAVQQEENSGQVRLVNLPGIKAAPKQPTEQPLGADRVTQLNSALQSRWNVLHPDAPLPSAYTLQPSATTRG